MRHTPVDGCPHLRASSIAAAARGGHLVIVVSRRLAAIAVATLVLAVLVTASLITPAVGAATATYTRVASCAGLSFYATDSNTTYSNIGALRTRTDNGGGTGAFRCDPGLPNHAVVTKVQFTAS